MQFNCKSTIEQFKKGTAAFRKNSFRFKQGDKVEFMNGMLTGEIWFEPSTQRAKFKIRSHKDEINLEQVETLFEKEFKIETTPTYNPTPPRYPVPDGPREWIDRYRATEPRITGISMFTEEELDDN